MVDDENKFKLNIEKKCSSCYKKDWCMLFPYQRAVDCLGPFKDVEDNQKKFREYCEEEKNPKADLDRAAREVVLNKYLRNKKLFDD
jgi:hypothetical protein